MLNWLCVFHQSFDVCQQLTHAPGTAFSLSLGPFGHGLPSKLSLHKHETHIGLLARTLTFWHLFRITRQVSGPYNPAPRWNKAGIATRCLPFCTHPIFCVPSVSHCPIAILYLPFQKKANTKIHNCFLWRTFVEFLWFKCLFFPVDKDGSFADCE